MTNIKAPVLGLDLDDTIAEYLLGLRKFIIKKDADFFDGMTEAELDAHFPQLPTYDNFVWSRINGNREKFIAYHAEAVENGLFADLEPIAGAVEALWKLKREHGVHIYVITSRFVQNWQNARVLMDTGVWLDKNNVPYDDIMFARDKVDVLADVYIDDSPKNITNLRKAGRNVIVYNQSYNQDFGGPRAHDWAEAYTLITDALCK
jgi:5'(3')-deoxyribonucleotidase